MNMKTMTRTLLGRNCRAGRWQKRKGQETRSRAIA